MKLSIIYLFLFLCCTYYYFAQDTIILNKDTEEEEAYLQSLHNIEQLLNQGRTIDALQIIYSLSNEDKVRHEVRVSLARAYVQLKKIKEAEEVLLDVISFADAPMIAYMTISRLYVQLQRWNEAQEYLESILSLDPNHYQALTFLSKVWLNRDRNVLKAKDYIERAYQIQPNDERVLFDYAMVLFQNKEDVQAKAALDQAEILNPSIDHKMIGNVYLYYQHNDWAVPHFEKALFKQPSSSNITATISDNCNNNTSNVLDPDVAVILADCKDNLGDAEMAYQLYNTVLEIEPNHALAHAGIGMLMLGTGNRNFASINACGLNQHEAVDHLLAALQVKPDLSLAKAALEFCQLEFSQVKSWQNIVENKIAKHNELTSINKQQNNVISSAISQQLYHSLFLPVATKLCKWWETTNHQRKSKVKLVNFLMNYLDQAIEHFICRRASVARTVANNYQKHDAVSTMKESWKARERQFQHSSVSSIVLLLSTDQQSMESRIGNESVYGDLFINEYMLKNKPDSWGRKSESSDITNRARMNSFSIQSLLKEFGDQIVRVSVSETGRFDGPESGLLWGLSATDDVLVRPPATSMLFKDFLHLVKSNTKETFYLEYLALHQYLGQSFLDLIPLPESIAKAGLNKLEHLVTNLWIGSKPTTSPLHYDDYENFLCQIAGQKELMLFPPADIDNLYYVGRAKGTLKYEYPGIFTRDTASIDRKHYVFGSSVNINHIDEKKFPKYHKATPIRVVLHPGEVLYLPAYWHHEVQSIPDPVDGLNIAVNFWFRNLSYPINDINILGINA